VTKELYDADVDEFGGTLEPSGNTVELNSFFDN
jgi:hypothetical protein